MKMIRNMAWPAVAAMAIVAVRSQTHGATIPVTDWVVHNSVGAVTADDEETNSPKFTAADMAADTMTVMAPFSSISLANDGDYIKLTTILSMSNRSTTGINTLNTHLRFGLFDGPAGTVVAADAPNHGIFAQYANANQGHLKVFEQATATDNPMNNSHTLIGEQPANVVVDPENDSIQGANPSAYFEMTLTRNGGNLDVAGQISGGNYLSTFSIPGFNSATFPTGGPFTFNRVGFFLGNNVNAQDGSTFADVLIETNVPEPGSCLLAATVAVGGLMMGRPVRRTSRHRSPSRR